MTVIKNSFWQLMVLAVCSMILSACTGSGARSTPTAELLGNQRITIEAPPVNATISSPVLVRGTLAQPPSGSAINYRVFDARNALVGSGVIAVQPEAPTRFSGQITFATTQAGPGRLELFEFIASASIIRGGVVVPVTLTAAGLTSALTPSAGTAPSGNITPLPGTTTLPGMATAQVTLSPQSGQFITIESPAPGTQVGSPVVVTGRTTRPPAQARLLYRMMDANERQIGAGTIPVSAGADGVPRFNASLSFTVPTAGGAIRIDLADQADGAATPSGVASLALTVAAPNSNSQQITFSSPTANTAVNSPVVISGRTTRMPFQNNLSYTIRDNAGRMLASGLIGVDGSPPSFNVALPFEAPAPGTAITIELLDQDADTGNTVARASLPLFYATLPQPTAAAPTVTAVTATAVTATAQPATQVITIETPASNTTVGSPMTITGRVAVTPNNGRLFYRVLDANNSLLGENSFAIGTNQQALAFNVALTFNLPQNAGTIVLELTDRDANGSVRARTVLSLQVASAYPSP